MTNLKLQNIMIDEGILSYIRHKMCLAFEIIPLMFETATSWAPVGTQKSARVVLKQQTNFKELVV